MKQSLSLDDAPGRPSAVAETGSSSAPPAAVLAETLAEVTALYFAARRRAEAAEQLLADAERYIEKLKKEKRELVESAAHMIYREGQASELYRNTILHELLAERGVTHE